ncbi:MAG: signal peptidase I [Candidatus Bathyarchaeota archaeon]|nr:signal peptidase I [Candidatus Bathyarchaeota archaeon]
MLKTRFKGCIIVAILVLAYIGAWFSLCYILKTSNPIVVVEGSSMYPNLKTGDLVFLKGTSKEELVEDFKMGVKSIIVYSLPTGKNIIHRVYSVVYDDENKNVVGFLTKGDNNPYVDGIIVTEEMIIGKVVFGPVPYIGFLVLFLRSPPGFILIIILATLLVVSLIIEKNTSKGGIDYIKNVEKKNET